MLMDRMKNQGEQIKAKKKSVKGKRRKHCVTDRKEDSKASAKSDSTWSSLSHNELAKELKQRGITSPRTKAKRLEALLKYERSQEPSPAPRRDLRHPPPNENHGRRSSRLAKKQQVNMYESEAEHEEKGSASQTPNRSSCSNAEAGITQPLRIDSSHKSRCNSQSREPLKLPNVPPSPSPAHNMIPHTLIKEKLPETGTLRSGMELTFKDADGMVIVSLDDKLAFLVEVLGSDELQSLWVRSMDFYNIIEQGQRTFRDDDISHVDHMIIAYTCAAQPCALNGEFQVNLECEYCGRWWHSECGNHDAETWPGICVSCAEYVMKP